MIVEVERFEFDFGWIRFGGILDARPTPRAMSLMNKYHFHTTSHCQP